MYRITREIAQIEHIFDTDLIARFLIDTLGVGPDDLHNTGSDRTVSENRYIDHIPTPFL